MEGHNVSSRSHKS